jgi:hypothetical protein
VALQPTSALEVGVGTLTVLRTFRAPENPYHRFFVCRK